MTSFSQQSVLVTGAAGFLGASLCRRLLEEGANVHALVRTEAPQWRLEGIRQALDVQVADITDAERLQRAISETEPRVVFHLAARSFHAVTPEERSGAVQVSVVGTANLLAALERLPETGLVHVGSSLEYGQSPAPLTESAPLAPVTFRGAVKAAAAILCQQFAREHGRDVVILRPFSIYGPWESGRRFIAAALLAALDVRELPLTQAEYRHDFVFVDDVVEACLRGARLAAPRGDVLNVGTGRQWTNQDVVTLINQSLHLRLRVRPGDWPPRPVDTGNWVADMSKTERLLGWRPATDLRDGLAIAAEWFRKHRSFYDVA